MTSDEFWMGTTYSNDEVVQSHWTKINYVANQDETPKNEIKSMLLPEINSDVSAGIALETTIIGGAADLTIIEMGKSAPKALSTISKLSGGGVLGAVDNSVQTYNDYQKGNYGRAVVNGAQTAAYTTGAVMLLTPLAPVGAAILLWTTISDFI